MENVQVYQALQQAVQPRAAQMGAANAGLNAALDRVGTPEQLVRMCAWTRRLELDGEWLSIEEYLRRRFALQVTHAISDSAAAELGGS